MVLWFQGPMSAFGIIGSDLICRFEFLSELDTVLTPIVSVASKKFTPATDWDAGFTEAQELFVSFGNKSLGFIFGAFVSGTDGLEPT
jgi:hypothetical protein